MPRPSNPKTLEASILTKAITAAESSKAKVADHLDVTPGLVSQYASGHRPVPWDRAEPIAGLLGVLPELISSEYRRIVDFFGPSKLLRLTPEIISDSIETMKISTRKTEGAAVSVESDPRLFAEILRLKLLENEDGADDQRVRPSVGSSGRASGTQGSAQAGMQAKPKARRKQNVG